MKEVPVGKPVQCGAVIGIAVLLVMMVFIAICVQGCGTANGFGADTENAGRWLREVTQSRVDNMELRRLRSSVDTQTRLIKRGNNLEDIQIHILKTK